MMTGDDILFCCSCKALITSQDLELLRQFKAATLPYCQRCIEHAMASPPKTWDEYEARQKVATFEPTEPTKKELPEPVDKSALVPLQQLEVGMIAAALCAANMGEKGEEIVQRYFDAYNERIMGMAEEQEKGVHQAP